MAAKWPQRYLVLWLFTVYVNARPSRVEKGESLFGVLMGVAHIGLPPLLRLPGNHAPTTKPSRRDSSPLSSSEVSGSLDIEILQLLWNIDGV